MALEHNESGEQDEDDQASCHDSHQHYLDPFQLLIRDRGLEVGAVKDLALDVGLALVLAVTEMSGSVAQVGARSALAVKRVAIF